MYAKMKQFTLERPLLKKSIAIVLVAVGFFALVTPLTPGAFLLIIGLELLGCRILFLEKWFAKRQKQEVAIKPDEA